jgi:FKBP-type peptidyl-prolyl cis-trans isomerase (trigger factor)
MMLVSFAFTSCDSATSDAKKLAQIVCKVKELSKDGGYTKNADEIKKLSREAEDLRDKVEKKRKSMSDDAKKEYNKKMERAYEDELEKCNDK